MVSPCCLQYQTKINEVDLNLSGAFNFQMQASKKIGLKGTFPIFTLICIESRSYL